LTSPVLDQRYEGTVEPIALAGSDYADRFGNLCDLVVQLLWPHQYGTSPADPHHHASDPARAITRLILAAAGLVDADDEALTGRDHPPAANAEAPGDGRLRPQEATTGMPPIAPAPWMDEFAQVMVTQAVLSLKQRIIDDGQYPADPEVMRPRLLQFAAAVTRELQRRCR
jgi:hypothetical protein